MAREVDIPLGLKLDKLNNDLRTAEGRIANAVSRLEKAKKFQLSIETNLATKKISELRTIHQNLTNRFNKLIRLDVDVATLERAKGRIETVEKILRNLNQELKETPKNAGNAVDKMAKFGMIVTGLNQAHQLLTQLSGDFMQMVNSGAELEVLRSTFKGSAEDLQLFRQATAGTVTEANLIKLSNQATNLGVSMRDQVILFAAVEAAGDEMGVSLEESFQQAVFATEGNERVLKSLGIQKEKYQELVKDLANAHGDEINNLDAETQKQIRLDAIIQLSNMTYEKAINNTQDNKDKLEALGRTLEETKAKFGNLISKGLNPLIGALLGTGEAGEIALGGITVIGGAAINLVPQLLELKTMQKLLKVETAAAAATMDAEAVSAGAAAFASKGFLLTLGTAITIVGAVAYATYLYTEKINENTEAIKKNREEALKQHPEADKSGLGGKTIADEKAEAYNKRAKDKPFLWAQEDVEAAKKKEMLAAGETKYLEKRYEIEEKIDQLREKQRLSFAPGTPGDINIQKEIDALQKKLDVNKNIESSTKRISELEQKLYEGLSKSSDDYYNYKFDLLQKEVDAFYKAGADETLIMQYVNENFTKLDEERHNAVIDNLRKEIEAYQKAFDENYISSMMKKSGGIKGIKAAGEVDLVPNALQPVKGEYEKPEVQTDFGSETDILRSWINESELASAAVDGFISGAMSSFDELSLKTAENATFMEKAFEGFANAAIAAAERVIAEWAILNTFSFFGGLLGLGGGAGVNLFDMLGLSGKANGGPVTEGTPYKVGERGEEIFVPQNNGFIIPNSITKEIEGLTLNTSSFDLDISELPGRANGGPVTDGRPYKVGERGIELFIPERNGYIIPNDALQSNSNYGIKNNDINRIVNSVQAMNVNISRNIKKYNSSNIGVYGELASSGDIYISNRNQEKIRKRFGG